MAGGSAGLQTSLPMSGISEHLALCCTCQKNSTVASSGRYPLYSVCFFQKSMSNSGSPATAISSCDAVKRRRTFSRVSQRHHKGINKGISTVPQRYQQRGQHIITFYQTFRSIHLSKFRIKGRLYIVLGLSVYRSEARHGGSNLTTLQPYNLTFIGTISDNPSAIASACSQ